MQSIVIGRSQLYLSRICLPFNYLLWRGTSNNASKKPSEKGYLLHGLRQLFGKYLYITNTVTSAAIMGFSDILQQHAENVHGGRQKYVFDWKRTLNMMEVGAVQGILSHVFYLILDKQLPGTQLSTIAKKIAVDQIIFSPICITIFFLGMQFLESRSWESSVQELKEKFLFVYVVDCIVWIPSQFANFYYLPPRFRVLCLSAVSVVYNMFLSFIKHNNV
ncbi:UNVERIFIED_CONTAM: hypothetical protein PYX00_001309 [Menopon gallinae]|uniref:Mpv17-like protein 2 n=1 Tax=Menopon gallinae TaxID=328185 RepID=A0AAW2IDJ3_9NEOP